MDRFVVCGEALIDLAPAKTDDDSTFSSTWVAQSAGGPMNTAVALSRLELPVEFLGRLSTDRFGRQLVSHLEANEVGLDVAIINDDPTSMAIVSLDDDGKATFFFHFTGTANFGWQASELPTLGRGDWLHMASLVTVVDPGAEVLRNWVSGLSAPWSLDINVRPAVIPDPQEYERRTRSWLEILGRTGGLAKASDDDLEFMFPDTDPVDVTRQLVADHGLELMLLTRGPDGAAAVTGDGEVLTEPGVKVDVVDTIGAGDTFMAGFLGEYAYSGRIQQALKYGVTGSALACTRSGPQPPTLAELADHLGA